MPYTTARLNAALDAANDDITHVQLHTEDPGASGTTGVASNVSGREAIDLTDPGASNGEASDEVTFTITAGGEEYTHISLWNQSSGGTFQGSGSLTPPEEFQGAGTLDVTVNTSAANA